MAMPTDYDVENDINSIPKKQNLSIIRNHEKISSFIGIISFCSLIISVIYNYSYFTHVGIEFFSLLSPVDYIKSAIKVSPFIFVISFVIVISHLITKRLSSKSILHKNNKIFIYMFAYFIAINILIPVLISFEENIPDILLLMYAVMILIQTIGVITIFMYLTRLLPVLSLSTQGIVIAVLVFVFLAVTIGANDAKNDLENENGIFKLNNTTSGENVIKARVFKIIEKGILFRDMNDKKISFIPWDDVKLVKKEENYLFRSYIIDTGRSFMHLLNTTNKKIRKLLSS